MLVITVHHILVDDAAQVAILRELQTEYAAGPAGHRRTGFARRRGRLRRVRPPATRLSRLTPGRLGGRVLAHRAARDRCATSSTVWRSGQLADVIGVDDYADADDLGARGGQDGAVFLGLHDGLCGTVTTGDERCDPLDL